MCKKRRALLFGISLIKRSLRARVDADANWKIRIYEWYTQGDPDIEIDPETGEFTNGEAHDFSLIEFARLMMALTKGNLHNCLRAGRPKYYRLLQSHFCELPPQHSPLKTLKGEA